MLINIERFIVHPMKFICVEKMPFLIVSALNYVEGWRGGLSFTRGACEHEKGRLPGQAHDTRYSVERVFMGQDISANVYTIQCLKCKKNHPLYWVVKFYTKMCPQGSPTSGKGTPLSASVLRRELLIKIP